MKLESMTEACAREIMTTPLIAVYPETSCEDLMLLLIKNRISGAAVINEAGRLVGIITLHDIIKYKVQLPYLPSISDVKKGFVSDYMTRNVYTATPDMRLSELSRVMHAKRIHRTVIIDPESGKPIAMVSTFDFLKLFCPSQELLQKSVSKHNPQKPITQT